MTSSCVALTVLMYAVLGAAVACCSYALFIRDWVSFDVHYNSTNQTATKERWTVGLFAYYICAQDTCVEHNRDGAEGALWPYSRLYVDKITGICMFVGIGCYVLTSITGFLLCATRNMHGGHKHCFLHLRVSIPILIWIGACFTPFAAGYFANAYAVDIVNNEQLHLLADRRIDLSTAQYGRGFYAAIGAAGSYFCAGILSCVLFTSTSSIKASE